MLEMSNEEMVVRQIYVVLPAYNEGENISLLLDAFSTLVSHLENPLSFVIVDDGSTDSTEDEIAKYAEVLSINQIRHFENKGLSEALRSGFFSVLEEARDEDILVCMDADNTHLPSQIVSMILKIDEGYDVVIASRYRPGSRVSGVSFLRRALSRGSSLLCQFLLPTSGVRDFSCGFRAYRVKILREVLTDEEENIFSLKGFACTSALLFLLRRAGARATEIPIDLRYFQKRGISKMKVGKTAFESIRLIFKEVLKYKNRNLG
jgi:dolichol-phosphate mannosyltransferase